MPMAANKSLKARNQAVRPQMAGSACVAGAPGAAARSRLGTRARTRTRTLAGSGAVGGANAAALLKC